MKKILKIFYCLIFFIGLLGCTNSNIKLTKVNNAEEVFDAMLKSKSMPDSSSDKCSNVEETDSLWKSKVYWHDENVDYTSLADTHPNIGATIEVFDDIAYLKLQKKLFEVSNDTVDTTFGPQILGNNEKKLCNNLKQYIYIKGNIMLRVSYSVGEDTAKKYKDAFFECLDNYKYNVKSKISSADYIDAESQINSIGAEFITDLSEDVYQKYYDTANKIDSLFETNNKIGWNKKNYKSVKKLVNQYDIGLLSEKNDNWSAQLQSVYNQLYLNNNTVSTHSNNSNESSKKTFLDIFGKDNSIEYAKQCINTILKSPSSAEYPGTFLNPYDGWTIYAENDEIIVVKSYVDSQNSFGAMLRNNFTIKIVQADNTTAKVKYLELGGHVYKNE